MPTKVVRAADADLTEKLRARMGGPQPPSPEEYRRRVAKRYADGPGSIDFGAVRQQLAAAPGAVPAPAAPPAAMPLGLQATPVTGGTPLSLLGIDAADQAQLDQRKHDADWSIAAQTKGGKYVPPSSAAMQTPDLVFAQPTGRPGQAAMQGASSLPALGGGGGGTVPAHELALMDPKRYADLQAAQGEARSAQAALGQAEANQAGDAGVAASLRAQGLGQLAQDIQQRAAARDAEMWRREQQLDAFSKEVASQKIDTDWKGKQSPFDRVRLALASAFSGFKSGMRGGPNEALEVIQRETDRYIAAQREAIELKKGRLGDMQGLLASAYRRFGNMEQAEAAARAVTLQKMDAEQQAFAASSGSDVARAKSDALSAALKSAQQEANDRLFKYVPAQTVNTGPTMAQVQARAKELYDDAVKTGQPVTWEQAMAEAAHQKGAGPQGYSADTFGKAPGAGKTNPTVADQVAVMNAAVDNVNRLRGADGELPGTGIIARNVPGNPATSPFRSSEGRQVYGALWTVAESLAHANGQRGNEAIESNLKAIVGNGSQEDIDAGLRRAQAVVQARAKAAGQPGAGAGDEDTPQGFQPGAD